MDEENYKAVRANIISIPCVFEKSILALRVCCSMATKNNIAEREVVRCESAEYQACCENWLKLLRKKSQFALQLSSVKNESTALPHAKEMKVQVGGINGLALLLTDADRKFEVKSEVLHDVGFTLQSCAQCLGGFESVAFEQIIKSVVGFRLR